MPNDGLATNDKYPESGIMETSSGIAGAVPMPTTTTAYDINKNGINMKLTVEPATAPYDVHVSGTVSAKEDGEISIAIISSEEKIIAEDNVPVAGGKFDWYLSTTGGEIKTIGFRI